MDDVTKSMVPKISIIEYETGTHQADECFINCPTYSLINKMPMSDIISSESSNPIYLSSQSSGNILMLLNVLYTPGFILHAPSLPLLDDPFQNKIIHISIETYFMVVCNIAVGKVNKSGKDKILIFMN
uniref:BTB domain-containing protein n=1 Tax=Elaeophora elaphi TaxID=1147741 RepID=A0A0R3RN30_9BILA